jgi:outer membrane protein OmpA-like peptidoglycan-associated protein
MPRTRALLTLFWSASASAGDAHGPVPPPPDGDVEAPITLADPTLPAPGAVAFGLTAEYVNTPLQLELFEGGIVVDRRPILEHVLLGDASVSWGITRRVAVGATAPVYGLVTGEPEVTGPPALGDLHLWAPIGLAQGERFSFAAVPFVDLPTGDEERFLGDKGVGGGLLLAPGFAGETWGWTALVGGVWAPAAEFTISSYPAGPVLRAGGSAYWKPRQDVALGLELLSRLPLEGSGTPTEVLATARTQRKSGLWLRGGVGAGIASGISEGAIRAFLGVGYAPPRERGLVSTEPGVVLRVVDPDGQVVRDAVIREGDAIVARTDAMGRATLPAAIHWRRGVTVEAQGFFATTLEEPVAATDELTATLAWAPTELRLRVTDTSGNPVPAQVDVKGPVEVAAPTDDPAEGRRVWALPQGTWTVEITAAGFGRQTREVVVPRGRTEPLFADAVLLPDQGGQAELVLSITDALGDPVEGAQILVDGRPVGTSSTGGRVTIAALAEGKHDLVVESDVLKDGEQAVTLAKGATEATVALQFEKGSVLVIAKGPEGAVIDALARFDGPARLPPMPLGGDGKRAFVLRPGEWRLLVSSPTLGLQQREVLVPENAWELITVEVVLQADEAGTSELVVRVVDPEGQPVDGVAVSIDGQSVGSTSTGGTVRLQGLTPGPRRIEVAGPRLQPVAAQDVELVPGFQEQLVAARWKPGTIEIQARNTDGEPVDALIRMTGPGNVSGSLGQTGHAFFELTPGAWKVVASSTEYGVQTRTVTVAPDETQLVDIDMVLWGQGKAALSVKVTDPEGNPVEADLSLSGQSLGRTSTGGTLEISGLPSGTHTLEVAAPGLAAKKIDGLRLVNGPAGAVRDVKLEWAPGTVRVVARGPEGPVTDAIVRVAGPAPTRPVALDARGTRVIPLGAGEWSMLVSSARYGVMQRGLALGPSDKDLRTEEFVFAPTAADVSVLLVRVTEPSGAPVGGAEVWVAGQSRGTTSSGGAALVTDLPPGATTLEVRSSGHTASGRQDLELKPGSQQRFVTIAPLPAEVHVEVRGPDGQPVDAELRFEGKEPRDAVRVGSDGEERVALTPGTWQVYADAPTFGVVRAEIVAHPGRPEKIRFDLKPARIEFQGRDLVILERVHFDLAQTALSAEEDAVLVEVANTLRSRPDIRRVEIGGHTDSTGSLDYNMTLSEKRAEVVREALIARGVPPEVLVVRGYGPLRPIVPNDTEEGRATNRRVEFQVLEMAEGAEAASR